MSNYKKKTKDVIEEIEKQANPVGKTRHMFADRPDFIAEENRKENERVNASIEESKRIESQLKRHGKFVFNPRQPSKLE